VAQYSEITPPKRKELKFSSIVNQLSKIRQNVIGNCTLVGDDGREDDIVTDMFLGTGATRSPGILDVFVHQRGLICRSDHFHLERKESRSESKVNVHPKDVWVNRVLSMFKKPPKGAFGKRVVSHDVFGQGVQLISSAWVCLEPEGVVSVVSFASLAGNAFITLSTRIRHRHF
jgi:hypothetical protein